MKMKDLEGRNIKISARTITVKDDTGKTRGMVRDVRSWKEIPFNCQADIFHRLKAVGAWGAVKTDRIFGHEGKLWYIKDDHARIFWGNTLPDDERERIEQEEIRARLATAAGMQVVTVLKILN